MAINFLRSLVSQDLKRFKEGDVNLDLSYIRHNLIGNPMDLAHIIFTLLRVNLYPLAGFKKLN